jgi:hypothetical protein
MPSAITAPTRLDGSFHLVKPEYGEHSIVRAVVAGRITEEDATLIRQFITELRALENISVTRANKITYPLVLWRCFIGPPTAPTPSRICSGA